MSPGSTNSWGHWKVRTGGQFALSGWAIDPPAASAAAHVFTVAENRILAVVVPDMPRQDIAAGYGASFANCGFRIVLPEVTAAQITNLRVYAAQQDGTARELGNAEEVRRSALKTVNAV